LKTVLQAIHKTSIGFTNSIRSLRLHILNTARFEDPSHVAQSPSLPGCDTVLQGKWFLTLQRTNFWLIDPEHESTNILQNAGNYSTNSTASHPGRVQSSLTFTHCASSILGQAFRYSPENSFYIFNQQIYFIIW